MEQTEVIASSLNGQGNLSERDADFLLVQRVREGEVQLFDSLVRKYRERLFSVIYNMCGNREDASDLLQDTFIKAFRSLSKFRGKSAFYTWIYRIAVNTTLSHLKKYRLKRFFSFENLEEESVPQELMTKLVTRMGGDKATLLNEIQQKLNEALQTLSDKHRTTVVLFEIEGMSHQEIATIMNCSEGTVRSRLHYAKGQLQVELKEFFDS